MSEKDHPPSGRSNASTTQSYWDRFEIIDDCESDEADESEDEDVDMKELEGRAGMNQYQNADMDNDGVINDEIEDIESNSDDENAQIGAYIQEQQQRVNPLAGKVPGLSLGGLQGPSYGAAAAGQSFGGGAPAPTGNVPKMGGLNLSAINK